MFAAHVGRVSRRRNPTTTPHLSLPCGFDHVGLPIGMQIIGKHFDETMLLRLGYAYEQGTEWHTRRPTT